MRIHSVRRPLGIVGHQCPICRAPCRFKGVEHRYVLTSSVLPISIPFGHRCEYVCGSCEIALGREGRGVISVTLPEGPDSLITLNSPWGSEYESEAARLDLKALTGSLSPAERERWLIRALSELQHVHDKWSTVERQGSSATSCLALLLILSGVLFCVQGFLTIVSTTSSPHMDWLILLVSGAFSLLMAGTIMWRIRIHRAAGARRGVLPWLPAACGLIQPPLARHEIENAVLSMRARRGPGRRLARSVRLNELYTKLLSVSAD